MIDIEPDVIDAVAKRLDAKWPGIKIYSTEARGPAEFPCVTLYEMDNHTLESSRDSGRIENHAVITFQASVYSNLSAGHRSQCREIFGELDAQMEQMGFARMAVAPVSMSDATIYRLTGRFSAVVGRDGLTYGRG